MKTWSLIVVFCLMINIPCFSQYSFVLNASSTTLTGKKIYLSFMDFTTLRFVRVDSCVVTNNLIKMQGKMTQPASLVRFSVLHKGKSVASNFFLDSGINNFNMELTNDGGLLKLQSNSRSNHIDNELKNIFNAKAASTKINGYYQVTAALNSEIIAEQMKALHAYKNNFTAILSLYLIGKTTTNVGDAKKILTTLAIFEDSIRNSEIGKKLYDEKLALITNTESSKIGNKVKEFVINDIDNKKFNNNDLKGQNYLIVFSATWCGPCQEQLPRLKEIYKNYKSKGLKVVYFNNDDDVARWKKHVQVNKLDWINVSERLKPSVSKIQRSFGVYAIPTCLLVNKDGMIVYNSDQMDTELYQLETYIKKTLE